MLRHCIETHYDDCILSYSVALTLLVVRHREYIYILAVLLDRYSSQFLSDERGMLRIYKLYLGCQREILKYIKLVYSYYILYTSLDVI